MTERIKKLLQDDLAKILFRFHVFFVLAYFSIIIFKWAKLPPQFPLFYSLPKGEEQLGSALQILLLPFFSLLIFLINFLVAVFYYQRERLISILMLILSVIASTLLLITFTKIVFLVT